MVPGGSHRRPGTDRRTARSKGLALFARYSGMEHVYESLRRGRSQCSRAFGQNLAQLRLRQHAVRRAARVVKG